MYTAGLQRFTVVFVANFVHFGHLIAIVLSLIVANTMPVLSVLLKYWTGANAASPLAADQTTFSCPNNHQEETLEGVQDGEEKIMETRDNESQEMNGELQCEDDGMDNEITVAMEEEERAIHEQTSKEQQEMMQKAEQEWNSVEDKQKYLRLQHLLEKSSIYCQFLLERMENQKKEAQKQQEKLAKKLEKKQNEENNTLQKVPQIEGRVTRRAGKRLTVTTLSPQTDQTVPTKTKRGTRRKAQDSSSYMISKYLDRESLAKRQKVAEEGDQRENRHPVKESTSPHCDTSEVNKEQQGEHMAGCSRSDDEKSTIQPSFITGGSLRPYQLQGLAWLKVLYENGMNGILADEMGLGKTLQCISMLAFLIEMGVKGPFLIAAPLSTLPNWVREFHKFAPKIPVILYHGSQEERLRMRSQLEPVIVEGDITAFPVVVTSYEICMRDQRSMYSLDWKYIIVDEGHRIKNLNCKLIRELKTYKAANRLLLTGTPLQNNLSELWSLLNFLLPDIFDDLESFQKWFDFSAINEDGGSEKIIEQEREHQVLERLHSILTPFLLRRLKTDVELSLPPKKEVLVYAPLTQKQETFYKAALDKTLLDIVGDKKEDDSLAELSNTGRPKRKGRQDISYKLFYSENIDEEELQDFFLQRNNRNAACTSAPGSVVNIRMTNILMLLRKCCNHPYLLECPLEQGTLLRKVDEKIVTSSGKMLLLDQMLPVLKQRGHKVLIFSQMTKMMDIIEDYCILRKYGYSRLDGTMKVSDRQQEIKKFEVDPSVFIFLLSTRAGGLGLNLAMADTAIIFDSDWNPQVDLQAQDRCHRIGQTKPVIVYRFVTANTVDQKIVERASTKRKLEKMIIHKGKFKGKQDTEVIDAKELRELLASGDHDSVVSSEGLVMSDGDLEALLDRSDLQFKASARKKGKQPSNQTNTQSEFFRVVEDIPDS